jgi:hypothetical protein
VTDPAPRIFASAGTFERALATAWQITTDRKDPTMTTTGPRREKRVTYYTPGTFFAEDITRPIDDGPGLVERAAGQAPPGAFCFTLQTVIVAPPVPDGEGGVLAVVPKTVDRSGRYYLGGRLFDLDGVRAVGGLDTLARNMEGNGWAQVIRTRAGNWQPFEAGDTLLGGIVPAPVGQ